MSIAKDLVEILPLEGGQPQAVGLGARVDGNIPVHASAVHLRATLQEGHGDEFPLIHQLVDHLVQVGVQPLSEDLLGLLLVPADCAENRSEEGRCNCIIILIMTPNFLWV